MRDAGARDERVLRRQTMVHKVPITEYLDIDVDDEMWCCSRCGHKLISARENYKKGCLVYDRDPRTIYQPITGMDYDYAPDPEWCRFVEFYCPGCGTLVETEVLPPGHPITLDIELDMEKLKERHVKGRE